MLHASIDVSYISVFLALLLWVSLCLPYLVLFTGYVACFDFWFDFVMVGIALN